jgi:hypothetical protein
VARSIARADPEVRQAEQQHDTAAKAIIRADPVVRQEEQPVSVSKPASRFQLDIIIY